MVCFSPERFGVKLTFQPSLLRRRANAQNSCTPNLAGEKHTISTLVDHNPYIGSDLPIPILFPGITQITPLVFVYPKRKSL